MTDLNAASAVWDGPCYPRARRSTIGDDDHPPWTIHRIARAQNSATAAWHHATGTMLHDERAHRHPEARAAVIAAGHQRRHSIYSRVLFRDPWGDSDAEHHEAIGYHAAADHATNIPAVRYALTRAYAGRGR